MNKKQVLTILAIVSIIIITIVSVYLYIAQQIFEASNTPEQLEKIFSLCNCMPGSLAPTESGEIVTLQCPDVLVDWQNSTHYIDNNICEFQLLPSLTDKSDKESKLKKNMQILHDIKTKDKEMFSHILEKDIENAKTALFKVQESDIGHQISLSGIGPPPDEIFFLIDPDLQNKHEIKNEIKRLIGSYHVKYTIEFQKVKPHGN